MFLIIYYSIYYNQIEGKIKIKPSQAIRRTSVIHDMDSLIIWNYAEVKRKKTP